MCDDAGERGSPPGIPSTVAAHYELQALHADRKASHTISRHNAVAAVDGGSFLQGPDNLSLSDQKDDAASPQALTPVMSRAPLLLRSSPAHGTGSYGVLPVGSPDTNSDAESDQLARHDPRKTISKANRYGHRSDPTAARSEVSVSLRKVNINPALSPDLMLISCQPLEF